MIQRSVYINLFIEEHVEQVLSGIAVDYTGRITEGCVRESKST